MYVDLDFLHVFFLSLCVPKANAHLRKAFDEFGCLLSLLLRHIFIALDVLRYH